MNVLILLAVLFVSLAIVVPLLERSKFRMSSSDAAKWTRWIWPLLGLLIVAQLVRLLITG